MCNATYGRRLFVPALEKQAESVDVIYKMLKHKITPFYTIECLFYLQLLCWHTKKLKSNKYILRDHPKIIIEKKTFFFSFFN